MPVFFIFVIINEVSIVKLVLCCYNLRFIALFFFCLYSIAGFLVLFSHRNTEAIEMYSVTDVKFVRTQCMDCCQFEMKSEVENKKTLLAIGATATFSEPIFRICVIEAVD